MAVELLILVFFALVGVVLMKILMGGSGPEFRGPPPMGPQGMAPPGMRAPPPGQFSGPSPYGGRMPYPPMQGYYQPKARKKRILIMPESTVKSKKRRRRI